jgi:hypothetical protein
MVDADSDAILLITFVVLALMLGELGPRWLYLLRGAGSSSLPRSWWFFLVDFLLGW